MLVALAAFAGGVSSFAPALASTTSNNRGDVWTDIAGSNDGPENDPHMPCNTSQIDIWGRNLNASSGTFTIQGWPPSGSGASDVDWSGTWHYNTASGGQQIIAMVNVATLLDHARSHGDTAQAQGFHFKLDVEDPRTGASMGDDKYKVFWLTCPASSSKPHSAVRAAAAESASHASPTPATGGSPTPSASPQGGVLGLSTSNGAGGAAVATPNTGTRLALAVSGLLLVLGLGLMGAGRRLRWRR